MTRASIRMSLLSPSDCKTVEARIPKTSPSRVNRLNFGRSVFPSISPATGPLAVAIPRSLATDPPFRSVMESEPPTESDHPIRRASPLISASSERPAGGWYLICRRTSPIDRTSVKSTSAETTPSEIRIHPPSIGSSSSRSESRVSSVTAVLSCTSLTDAFEKPPNKSSPAMLVGMTIPRSVRLLRLISSPRYRT